MSDEDRVLRLQEIEKRLAKLFPTRFKTEGVPVVLEDLRGEIGKAKLEEIEALQEEKNRLMQMRP